MIEECVIIGAGVAGLSAANRLSDEGIIPLVIDAGKFPCHRVCGEFLSYECLPILRNWGIPVSNEMSRCRLSNGLKTIEFDFPESSGACSRFILDHSLLLRAKQNGVQILTGTSVITLNIPRVSSDSYEIVLSDGQTIKTRYLMIGTGRIPGMQGANNHVNFKYRGFKAHFEGVAPVDTLEMHTFPGGYLGLSTIDSLTANVACIVDMNYKKDCNSAESFTNELTTNSHLARFRERMANARMVFPQWMSGQLPEFGVRNNPSWKNVFWIGDAAGSIPPISGQGLSIGITSGCMAAEYYLRRDVEGFRKAWTKRYCRRFLIARMLHKMMIHPQMSSLAFQLGRAIPGLPLNLWKLTRES